MSPLVAIEAGAERAASLAAELSGVLDVVDGARAPDCRIVVLGTHPSAAEVSAADLERGGAAAPVVVVAPGASRDVRRALLAAGASEVVDARDAGPDAIAEAVADALARHAVASPEPHVADQLRQLVERSPNFVATADLDGRLTYLSPGARRMVGIAPDADARRFHVSDYVPADVRPFLEAEVLPIVRARGEWHGEMQLQHMVSGARIDVARSTFLLHDAAGAPIGYGTITRDITRRCAAEASLRDSEARFRRVFETNLLGILFWDLDGGVQDANDEFLRIIGYDRDDLAEGRIDWMAMTPPDHKAQDARALDELRRTGQHAPIEKEYVRKDGTRVWVLVGSARVDGFHGVGFVLDIGRQKRTEAALRDSEARAHDAAGRAEGERRLLDAVLEAAPAGIVVADADGRLLRFNRANARLWGPAPFSSSVAEYREWKGWWADASERHGRRLEPQEWAMARALRGEAARDIVEIEPFDQPGVRRTMVNSGAPVRDDAGRITGAVIVQTDITQVKEAEASLLALNEKLREADRRKDEFIGVLAHELRNPLAPVRLAVEILRRTGPADPRIEKVRDIIDRQVTHMARLIDDLLDVSRIARGKLSLRRERCDLATIVCQTAEDYRSSLDAAGIVLALEHCAPPVWVDGDPVRLAQMVGNLLHNASRFTDRGGTVTVRVRTEPARREAVVEVSDTGVGIAPALLARLFDPFSQAEQDLARSKGGLGLGLALTRGLAELHGGAVEAHSAGLGHGATFVLRLPRALLPAGVAPPSASTLARGPRRRILVVEDNQDAAITLGELLELAGHQVRLAFDGSTALTVAREFAPDVVISDLGLPGTLDGYGLAGRLRADAALRGVQLIALSGYANDDARRRSREAGFDAHLAKPPDIAALELALSITGRD